MKVHDRVLAGEMQPVKMAQPDEATRAAFLKALARPMIEADDARMRREGRAAWRRMNRYEYENTLRDLLGAPWLQVKELLPEDGEAYRFNKVGEALGYMYDFEWQNKNLSYGFYRRTRSFFVNSEMEAKGLPSPDELKILEPLRGKIPDEVFTKEYNPPKTDGTGNVREQARQAIALLKEAGWEIKDGKMTDKAGNKLAFELLLDDAAFERLALPYKQNLERIGVDTTVRTVDTSQYRRRTDSFDFDMVIDLWAQSLSPGNEQREFWGSNAADRPGSRNSMGLKDPAVDQLVDLVIAADTREDLVLRARCLDRVLQWIEFVIPQFRSEKELVAYWNRFARPQKTAKYEPISFDTWWVDEAKDKALQRGERK